MTIPFKPFRTRALARPEVRRAYDELAGEFSLIDEVLKARAASGLTQADFPPSEDDGFDLVHHGPVEGWVGGGLAGLLDGIDLDGSRRRRCRDRRLPLKMGWI